MKLVVSGCAGYIGSRLVEMALALGHHVVGIDAGWYGVDGVAQHATNTRFTLIEKDIRAVTAADLYRVDAVIHLAGFSNDPTADADPAFNHAVNVLGTEHLAWTAVAAGITTFTFGSSASVYDGARNTLCDEAMRDLTPQGAYATSKLAAERVLLDLAQRSDLRPVIFRQGTVYGVAPRMRFDLVVNAMVRDAVCRGVITVHQPGTNWRPLVDVDAVCRSHLQVVDHPPRVIRSEIYNLVGRNICMTDLARLVDDVVDAPTRITYAPTSGRVRDYRVDGYAWKRRARWYHGDSLYDQIQAVAARVQQIVDAGDDPYDARYSNLAALSASGMLPRAA